MKKGVELGGTAAGIKLPSTCTVMSQQGLWICILQGKLWDLHPSVSGDVAVLVMDVRGAGAKGDAERKRETERRRKGRRKTFQKSVH